MNPKLRFPDFRAARNWAISARGDSRTRAPAGWRTWPISGRRFRRKPSPQRATETTENESPGSIRPPLMNSRRGPETPISGFPRRRLRESQISASARNRAICGRGDSQTRAPAGRRNWSLFGPRFRRRPPQRQATQTPGNAPPKFKRRDPGIPVSGFPKQRPRKSKIFASARNRPICLRGDSHARTPIRSAQLVNYRDRFSPGTHSATRDGDAGTRAVGI